MEKFLTYTTKFKVNNGDKTNASIIIMIGLCFLLIGVITSFGILYKIGTPIIIIGFIYKLTTYFNKNRVEIKFILTLEITTEKILLNNKEFLKGNISNLQININEFQGLFNSKEIYPQEIIRTKGVTNEISFVNNGKKESHNFLIGDKHEYLKLLEVLKYWDVNLIDNILTYKNIDS
jgi:hypothetical protein